ncbi:hypothetical protein MRB53_034167 [Persea americana]|uniref:Uncharacterized protein n=1 Tax=Persea americana TaxID=3435 RepID=A0ACC2KXT4_PERAE|nr:hypothetical protein MRB53_034167 [Persea americana]|eukprot:TRINITY_DN11053_c0_g1_i5.p1 TRINITY_DN11053_c0_g1~~TRINITY_DN11053_c0_g1_i5.p1  ORF type:complete len:179 (+),score=15.89 TRINITY_DN11053_c0_g1_i5:218-754(+)
MPPPPRFFQPTGGERYPADPPAPDSIDSAVVVILAALLCALISVVGLALVARCAWLRRPSFTASGGLSGRQTPANKGLKKKVIRSLPKLSYNGAVKEKLPQDCPICLAEFADGDEVRLLPQCGHGFHAACVDTWLGAHSSCPTCRQILSAGRCQKCGGFPAAEGEVKETEDDANRFLA